MLVSNWPQKYWAVSTVAKKNLYDNKNLFGRVVEPFIGSKDLGEESLMDIQMLVLATTRHQARLALMILKPLCREAMFYGMTEKNPKDDEKSIWLDFSDLDTVDLITSETFEVFLFGLDRKEKLSSQTFVRYPNLF